MSRSGYSDDCGGWSLICWRGAVTSALKGKRGQEFLIELRAALDAMPEKRLIAEELVAEGDFCTLGVIGAKRGMDMTGIVPDDRYMVADAFGIAPAMAAEIVFENDEYPGHYATQPDGSRKWVRESPEHRWTRMRNWVDQHILKEQP